MTRESILKVRIGALELTLSFSSTCTGEIKTKIASKNSELDSATAELKSAERRLRLAENAASLMQEQEQSKGP